MKTNTISNMKRPDGGLGDSQVRRHLVGRFLEAETTLAEERLLAEYYAMHKAEPGEEAVAKLLTVSALPETDIDSAMSETGDAEVEEIAAEERRRMKTGPRRWLSYVRWTAALTACAAALIIVAVLWKPSEPENTITPMEIAKSLSTLASLDIGDIEGMTARPVGDAVVITVDLKDGSTSSYLLTRGTEDGELKMMAMAE